VIIITSFNSQFIDQIGFLFIMISQVLKKYIQKLEELSSDVNV